MNFLGATEARLTTVRIAAAICPASRAFEFGWEGAEEPDYPNLWVDGMQRSQKSGGFLRCVGQPGVFARLRLIRLSMERREPLLSIGPQQREGL